MILLVFFFNDTATTEIYTLSLHDALPIYSKLPMGEGLFKVDLTHKDNNLRNLGSNAARIVKGFPLKDRKSTRLNLQSRQYLVCRLLLEKKKQRYHDVISSFGGHTSYDSDN